jgi:hypothetical protein
MVLVSGLACNVCHLAHAGGTVGVSKLFDLFLCVGAHVCMCVCVCGGGGGVRVYMRGVCGCFMCQFDHHKLVRWLWRLLDVPPCK